MSAEDYFAVVPAGEIAMQPVNNGIEGIEGLAIRVPRQGDSLGIMEMRRLLMPEAAVAGATMDED
jgi:hypothetical protein